tara:strand:- start:132 stop:401 length:270 start_codon:yes stop_codon:yes gene_type:complete
MLPGAKGEGYKRSITPGRSIAAAIPIKYRHIAVQRGVEKRRGTAWEKVPLTYSVRRGDTIRIAPPKTDSQQVSQLVRIVKAAMRGKARG